MAIFALFCKEDMACVYSSSFHIEIAKFLSSGSLPETRLNWYLRYINRAHVEI